MAFSELRHWATPDVRDICTSPSSEPFLHVFESIEGRTIFRRVAFESGIVSQRSYTIAFGKILIIEVS